MRLLSYLFIGTLLIAVGGCKKDSINLQESSEDFQAILDEQLTVFQSKFPGKTIGFGMYIKSSNANDRGVYVSSGFPENYGENIHFRGASTTKSFTAAGILTLHQQGKLDIDDLITANIPGTDKPYIPATEQYAVPFKERITIRLLLQHRAGVFDITNTNIPDTVNAAYAGERYLDYVLDRQGGTYTFSFPELINVAAENGLSYFEPGEAFHYSNTGYNMLATIIERVSGKRYDQFLQDEFLTPLQMTNTRFPYLGTDQDMPTPYLPGWLKVNNELVEIDKNNISSAVSEGNIITTPADLAKWAHALYGSNKILNKEIHSEMISGTPTNEEHVNYGLGTELNPADIGYGHNGARPAYMTIMRFHPESNSSYILVANFLDADDLNGQGEILADMVRRAIEIVKSKD